MKARPYRPKENPQTPIGDRSQDRKKIEDATQAFIDAGGEIERPQRRSSSEIIAAMTINKIAYKNRPI